MSITSLQRVDGPECPRCGCPDSTILLGASPRWISAVDPKTGAPWGQNSPTQRRRCRACGELFYAPPASAPADEPAASTPPAVSAGNGPPSGVRYYVLRCPKCRSDQVKVTKTMHPHDAPTVRYHKCGECGHRFKSVESEG